MAMAFNEFGSSSQQQDSAAQKDQSSNLAKREAELLVQLTAWAKVAGKDIHTKAHQKKHDPDDHIPSKAAVIFQLMDDGFNDDFNDRSDYKRFFGTLGEINNKAVTGGFDGMNDQQIRNEIIKMQQDKSRRMYAERPQELKRSNKDRVYTSGISSHATKAMHNGSIQLAEDYAKYLRDYKRINNYSTQILEDHLDQRNKALGRAVLQQAIDLEKKSFNRQAAHDMFNLHINDQSRVRAKTNPNGFDANVAKIYIPENDGAGLEMIPEQNPADVKLQISDEYDEKQLEQQQRTPGMIDSNDAALNMLMNSADSSNKMSIDDININSNVKGAFGQSYNMASEGGNDHAVNNDIKDTPNGLDLLESGNELNDKNDINVKVNANLSKIDVDENGNVVTKGADSLEISDENAVGKKPLSNEVRVTPGNDEVASLDAVQRQKIAQQQNRRDNLADNLKNLSMISEDVVMDDIVNHMETQGNDYDDKVKPLNLPIINHKQALQNSDSSQLPQPDPNNQASAWTNKLASKDSNHQDKRVDKLKQSMKQDLANKKAQQLEQLKKQSRDRNQIE